MPRYDYRVTLDNTLSVESRTLARLLLDMVNPLRKQLDLPPLTEAEVLLRLRGVPATSKEGA